MQPREFIAEAPVEVEQSAPVAETVLAAIRADAVVETVQYIAEVVTQMDGE